MRFFPFLFLVALFACEPVQSQDKTEIPSRTIHSDFGAYWYQGKAEISTYKLIQTRYGEKREGQAVFVYVTEDFLTDKQVKHEFGSSQSAAKVLKLNKIRRFVTGIYDYSLMTSVFTPIYTNEAAYKITSTMQDWCGHQFSQINRRDNQIHLEIRSYFQAEGDQNIKLDNAITEDDLLMTVRLNPESLPKGTFLILPAIEELRLLHMTPKLLKATGATKKINEQMSQFTVTYQDLDRSVSITYHTQFPHKITEIKTESKKVSHTMVLENTIMSDYWSRHSSADEQRRKSLGVKSF